MANRNIPNPLTDEQKDFIKSTEGKYTKRQLADHLKIDYGRVQKFVDANFIQVKKHVKLQKAESDFFDYDRMYL